MPVELLSVTDHVKDVKHEWIFDKSQEEQLIRLEISLDKAMLECRMAQLDLEDYANDRSVGVVKEFREGMITMSEFLEEAADALRMKTIGTTEWDCLIMDYMMKNMKAAELKRAIDTLKKVKRRQG